MEGGVYKFEAEKPAFAVHNLGNGRWLLDGEGIERAFKTSKIDSDEDAMRFARKLRMMKVDDALREAGCQDGDIVTLCNVEFTFVE